MQFIKMNGAEVFRFATRVMVSSAEELLAICGATVDDVDLYVPHQANKRIVDHAAKNLGLDPEKVLMNIDRYGNTSSASIPICLAEAQSDGRLEAGTARADERGRRGPHLGLGLSDLDDQWRRVGEEQ